MSSEKKYSKVGELFYKEVGIEEKCEISIESFIKKSFKVYHEKYFLGSRELQSKKFYFNGCENDKNNRTQIALTIYPLRGSFVLDEIEINASSTSDDFAELINSLRGSLTAEFENLLTLESSGMKQDIEKAGGKEKGYVNTGTLGFYFSPDPRFKDLIRKIKLEKKTILGKRKELKIETSELTDEVLKLFSMADRISIINPQHMKNDEWNDLIIESCTIVQPKKGVYVWNYDARTPNREGLPVFMLEDLKNLFKKIENNFDENVLKNMKVEDPIRSFGSGDEQPNY